MELARIMILSYKDYKYFLEKDSYSTFGGNLSLKQKVKRFFFPTYEWKFIRALRWLEYCDNVYKKNIFGFFVWVIAKFRFRRLSLKLGYSIPINVFGPGLSLPHRGNIVINPNTIIGKNCRIHVGVNIGAHRDKAPKIGNNVYIGPGAIIFGDIEIADNVCIGANATINKSILQPNSIVVGTPGKIVKTGVLSYNGVKPNM